MAKVTMTPALGAAGGSMSNLSFVRQSDGTTSMRERKGGRQPRTPAKLAGEAACRRVSKAWQELDDDARQAWETYSEILHSLGPTPSLSRPRPGYRVFSQLGLKALQATPDMAVPSRPPSAPFYGDGARVDVTPSPPWGRGGRGVRGDGADDPGPEGEKAERPDGEGALTPTPLPQRGEESGIRFTCLLPNAPGVATELLVQPLASPGRKGEADKYRSRGFVSFAAAGQTVDVPCPVGTALVAVRFVELASGGASGIVPLGRVRLGSG